MSKVCKLRWDLHKICSSKLIVKVAKMGLAASQGRMLLLTARKSDLEYRAQQISQRRLLLSQELEAISTEYEEATSNRQMSITLWAGGTSSTDGSNITTNLTYAALMSGTATYDSSVSGVNIDSSAYDGYSSSVAYRLVDSNGAIVVSSEDEIPTEFTSSTTATTISAKSGGCFRTATTTTTTSTGEENTSDSYSFFVASKDSDIYDALSNVNAFNDDGVASGQCEYYYDENTNKTYIRIGTTSEETDENGIDTTTTSYTYYDINGTEINGNAVSSVSDEDWTSMVAYKEGSSEIPQAEEGATQKTALYGYYGSDGYFYLNQSDGSTVKYLVDASLANATSTSDGTTSDVNYLQDCIRNGKYLIQKYNTDSKEWSDMSWENASNITDSYYTDDDAAAKAKYDRLSNEIEAQDKKLELELDNIETQRSAVSTEEESVQKVIDENIEGSFDAFA